MVLIELDSIYNQQHPSTKPPETSQQIRADCFKHKANWGDDITPCTLIN